MKHGLGISENLNKIMISKMRMKDLEILESLRKNNKIKKLKKKNMQHKSIIKHKILFKKMKKWKILKKKAIGVTQYKSKMQIKNKYWINKFNLKKH